LAGVSNCGHFSGSISSDYARVGISNGTSSNRWNDPTILNCHNAANLVCLVNPGNESATTNGYFVMTDTTYDGNLGGRTGANAKCLTELTTNTNWMGYSDANTRGLLNSTNVGAFICDTALCGNLLPLRTYLFGLVGDSTIGGGQFTTTGSSIGPGDAQNWAQLQYFGNSYDWWSNRDTSSSSTFSAGRTESTAPATCSSFTSNSVAESAYYGNTNGTSGGRWELSSDTCDQTKRLICYVNP